MKTIEQIISNLDITKDHTINDSPSELDIFTRKIINKLFLTFEGIFPAFEKNYGSKIGYDNAKREWLKAFIQEGINDLDKIKIVCEECRKIENPFLLSIGKFISMYKNIGVYEKKYPMLNTERLLECQKAQPEIVKNELGKIKSLLS